MVPAPTRRESAEASEGKDKLEIEYQPAEGLEEASEDHSPEEARGHESNGGAARTVRFSKLLSPSKKSEIEKAHFFLRHPSVRVINPLSPSTRLPR